jgi:hypothetical protein
MYSVSALIVLLSSPVLSCRVLSPVEYVLDMVAFRLVGTGFEGNQAGFEAVS